MSYIIYRWTAVKPDKDYYVDPFLMPPVRPASCKNPFLVPSSASLLLPMNCELPAFSSNSFCSLWILQKRDVEGLGVPALGLVHPALPPPPTTHPPSTLRLPESVAIFLERCKSSVHPLGSLASPIHEPCSDAGGLRVGWGLCQEMGLNENIL